MKKAGPHRNIGVRPLYDNDGVESIMKITVFTSNRPRHIALVHHLAKLADEVYAVSECKTNFPGKIPDRIPKSSVMEEYSSHVIKAEEEVSGTIRFFPKNISILPMRAGDLNFVNTSILKPALSSDQYVVFGSSYIKGELGEFLVANKAKNIHMGVSPYYRGNSCNFWALYDGRPDLVGATIHVLGKGLDSGGILFHAFPEVSAVDPFIFGMKAVRAAHSGLVHYLETGKLDDMLTISQDKTQELRYTRAADFSDEVAQSYLYTSKNDAEFYKVLKTRNLSNFVRPYFEK
jgi:hypothetical protein